MAVQSTDPILIPVPLIRPQPGGRTCTVVANLRGAGESATLGHFLQVGGGRHLNCWPCTFCLLALKAGIRTESQGLDLF